jgi:hypothetical protein
MMSASTGGIPGKSRNFSRQIREVPMSVHKARGQAERTRGFTLIELLNTEGEPSQSPDEKVSAPEK